MSGTSLDGLDLAEQRILALSQEKEPNTPAMIKDATLAQQLRALYDKTADAMAPADYPERVDAALIAVYAYGRRRGHADARIGPYQPPVVYDPKRGVMVDTTTGLQHKPALSRESNAAPQMGEAARPAGEQFFSESSAVAAPEPQQEPAVEPVAQRYPTITRLADMSQTTVGYQGPVLVAEAVACLRELQSSHASAAQPAVEEGFVLVPREPTDEMVRAGIRFLHADEHEPALIGAYRAMLAAAPKSNAPDSVNVQNVTPEMVNRFLCWKLPESFSPDCGISFKRLKHYTGELVGDMPVGTNLFSADEAKAMLEHVLAAAPKHVDSHD